MTRLIKELENLSDQSMSYPTKTIYKKKRQQYESEESSLSEDEQQIVRYVAGFVFLEENGKKINEGRNEMVAIAAIQFLKFQ